MTQTPSAPAPLRTAIVRVKDARAELERVARYLPSNYRISRYHDDRIIVQGTDNAGWTLDGYVIPRLASGLIFAEEVETTDATVTKVTLLGPAPLGGSYTSTHSDPKVAELIEKGWTVSREWEVLA